MKRWIWVLCLLAGCGDDAPCAAPEGAYTVTLVEVSGDCGPVPEFSVQIGEGSPAGCRRMETASADGCYVERTQVCTSGPNAGGSATMEMHISRDGLSMSGDIGTALRDPDTSQLICASQYEFTGVFVAP